MGANGRSLLVGNTAVLDVTNTTNATYRCNPLLENVDDGAPEVVAINLAVWVVVLLLFIIMRYTFRDFSKVGLIANKRRISITRKKCTSKIDEMELDEEVVTVLPTVYDEVYCYSWIINFFKLKDETIRKRCGPDAVVYLSLERHIIILLSLLSILSIVIILPINYFGGLDERGFARTTISNIKATKDVLWVHTLFSLLYLAITGAFMIRFSLKLGKYQQDESSHTVMIQKIPHYVHREDILQHFQEALPDAQVADLQFAYDVAIFTKLSHKLEGVEERLVSAGSVKEELGKVERIRPGCSKLCCWDDSYLIDAETHYGAERLELTQKLSDETARVKTKRLGIGFLTFVTEKDARKLVTYYKPCHFSRPSSSLSLDIHERRWWISQAPFPLDIQWENLSIPHSLWWIRWIFINTILFLFLFFFTTPSILLTSVDQIRILLLNASHTQNVEQSFDDVSPLLRVYSSSLLLLLFASLLPLCVSRSCLLEAHWTYSQREQTVMRKTFIFLVLMLIFLPSIGLTSLNAAAELVAKDNEGLKQRLDCVFLPSSGAFFMVYVLTSALIGTSLELLRLPQLLLYAYHRFTAKTRLQREQALKKASEYEFLYGVQYAWQLVIFTMVMTYGLTTPVIMPVGVLYFILRYYTDRYNIFYVYKPAPFNGRQFLHRTAINLVIVGAVHLQISTLFYSIVRLGGVDPRTVLLLVALSLTLAVCVAFMVFGWFSHMLPQLRLKMGKEYRIFSLTSEAGAGQEGIEETIVKGAYIPPVLQRCAYEAAVLGDDSVNGYQSFGCTDRLGRHSPTSSPSPSPSSSPFDSTKSWSNVEPSQQPQGHTSTLPTHTLSPSQSPCPPLPPRAPVTASFPTVSSSLSHSEGGGGGSRGRGGKRGGSKGKGGGGKGGGGERERGEGGEDVGGAGLINGVDLSLFETDGSHEQIL